jgi:proteasome alpha subunit
MFEEPYRWVEAVGNRRYYLDEQFKLGSPVIALSYSDGVLLLTVSRGTPKLYEIYDRIALGGMGHPADLEKLRFSLLEMAHLEGFNRSPSDVTGGRLMKYGLAPVIKQAFEEVYKAPFIVKILLAEIGSRPDRDVLLTIDYDGSFEEAARFAVLAASPAIQVDMAAHLASRIDASLDLHQALDAALETWALASMAQQRDAEAAEHGDGKAEPEKPHPTPPDRQSIDRHLQYTLKDKHVECAVLERHASGSSKYRGIAQEELRRLLPDTLR